MDFFPVSPGVIWNYRGSNHRDANVWDIFEWFAVWKFALFWVGNKYNDPFFTFLSIIKKIPRNFARKSTQKSPFGFNVPFSPTETESWTKICRSQNDGTFSRKLCHLGSGECGSDECQCLPDVAGLNIPTDAERFSMGQLLCFGLLVFGIVFGGWWSRTKSTQIFFLDYPWRFHKWMLDYPVICQGKNQAANGCSTNLEGNSHNFHPRRDVWVGVIFHGSRWHWRTLWLRKCWTFELFQSFFFPFFLASELEFFRRAPVVLLFL